MQNTQNYSSGMSGGSVAISRRVPEASCERVRAPAVPSEHSDLFEYCDIDAILEQFAVTEAETAVPSEISNDVEVPLLSTGTTGQTGQTSNMAMQMPPTISTGAVLPPTHYSTNQPIAYQNRKSTETVTSNLPFLMPSRHEAVGAGGIHDKAPPPSCQACPSAFRWRLLLQLWLTHPGLHFISLRMRLLRV